MSAVDRTIDTSESQVPPKTPADALARRRPDISAINVRGPGSAKSIMDVIRNRADALKMLAGRHLTPERLITMIGGHLTRVPHLAECTPISVLTCAMNLVELGLDLQLGKAYLVPFKNTKMNPPVYECTLIIGYRGYIALAYRHSKITFSGDVVREGDEFRYRIGLSPDLYHVPKCPEPKKDGTDVLYAWCIAQIPGARPSITVINRSQINAVRARSKASSYGPWVTDYAAMALKTTVRRAWKLLPIDSATEAALAGERTVETLVESGIDIGDIPVAFSDAEEGGPVEEIDEDGVPVEPVGTRAQQVVDALRPRPAEADPLAGTTPIAPAPGDEERRSKIAEQAGAAKKAK